MPQAAELDGITNFTLLASPLAQKPQTIASANTIAPVSVLTVLTGNTVIKTITPPLPNSVHVIALQFAGVAGVDATGNIKTLKASVVGEVMLLIFDPVAAKYVPVG
jgi:hypothetical protein